jgi:4-carboxymuconolactone decarboxylase
VTNENGQCAAAGVALMHGMLGPEVVERLTKRNEIAPDWHRWTTEVLFGDVWQGADLDLRTRSMITVAALISLSFPRELGLHMRGALHNGVTIEELAAIIQHIGFYAGWPAAGQALNILTEIAAETADDHAS